MISPYSVATAALLAFSVSLLTSMVPGGVIENRSFTHLSRVAFWGFNAFLVLLGCGSAGVIVLLLIGIPQAPLLSLTAGALIMSVFLLDLLGLFPHSPDKMSDALKVLEALSLAAGSIVVILSVHLMLS